jgi:NurA-like 5'-3' nuclease
VSKLPIATQYLQIVDKPLFFSKKYPERLHIPNICCTFAANLKNVMVISEMAITKTRTRYAIL